MAAEVSSPAAGAGVGDGAHRASRQAPRTLCESRSREFCAQTGKVSAAQTDKVFNSTTLLNKQVKQKRNEKSNTTKE